MLHVQMAGEQSITILHLSDLQFGPAHRFGQLALPPPDDQFDTLFTRLTDDLGHLRASHHLAPQLVVVTGDIAERGKAKEFDDALRFLDNLGEFLGLQRHRIIVIPGNHDINRMMCESYFNRCAADDEKPVPPYWPKWEQYSAFFQKLYAGKADFTFAPDQPRTLFPIPELKVVVAGLNSTMAESHITHHGHVGEAQLRWFAERLDSFRAQGWLRIGAVHHNVQRKCTDDDENLHDAKDLERILGPSLNLVLHGHTHENGLGWLNPRTPIISTGSAAVIVAARPEEVPNQYQVLQLSAYGVNRWTRRFDPPKKQWIADTSSSESGDEWITEHDVSFAKVDATFPKPRSSAAERDLERNDRRPESEIRRSPEEIFLDLVRETCQHRYPGAAVTPVARPTDDLFYLRVLSSANGIQQHFPVAAFNRAPEPAQLDRFINEIVAQFRAHDPGLRAEVVYGGIDHVSFTSAHAAANLNLRLFSLLEYRGLIDFRRYLEKQTAELDANPAYPDSLYVPQAMEFEEHGEVHHTSNAFDQAREWLTGTYGRFVLILGDFGTGKTFLMRQLARDLAQPASGVTPLLVELRPLEKARSLDELMAAHLTRMGIEELRLPAFRHMLATGRVVLLFDGFDELAGRVSYDRALEHFDTLLEATGGEARIVVTSRTSHFENENQVRKKLGEKATEVAALRYCRVQRFDEDKICHFLKNRFGNQPEADRWFELLHDVNDLLGLSEYPRMLSFITDLDRQELEKARNHEGKITAATLYRKVVVDKWLDHEYRRLSPKGAEPLLDPKQRLDALTHFAMLLWTRTDRWITVAELSQQTTGLLQTLAPEKAAEAAIAAHQIGSGTLLVRDDEGRFAFSHQSIMEWLVANQAANELAEKGESPTLAQAELSLLMAEFLVGLQPELAQDWAGKALAKAEGESPRIKANALRILERLARNKIPPAHDEPPRLNLSEQDLRQEDLSHVDLRSADLRRANLADQRLADKNLTVARLDGASFVRADLTRALLTHASLEGTDFSEARLLGADLRGARMTASVWRRAKLIGALLDDSALVGLDTWGAALPDATEASPASASSTSSCTSLVWSPEGSLVATGHRDGIIRLWAADSGKELRQFTGHRGSVTGVAFSSDGNALASTSDDKTVRLWEAGSGREFRQLTSYRALVSSVAFSPVGRLVATGHGFGIIRLWEMDSGRELHQFTGHRDYVRSVAFTTDGNLLASGGADNMVRLWEAGSGRELRQFTGHEGSVSSVAFSPDGTCLASCGADKTVRLWEASSGRELRQFRGHEGSVSSVAFSPDGTWLASGSADETVRLWEAASGRELRQFKGHKGSVSSVAFSPDGSWLASGGDITGVRLWEAGSGRELRQFTSHQDAYVWSVAFSPDGSWLASGSGNQSVRLWEVGGGRELRQFTGHEDFVRSVAFSPDGTRLASGSDDKTMRLWEAKSGRELLQFTGHQNSVRSVTFSPSGAWLASGSDDKTVRLWEAGSGKELRKFTGHQDWVRSVAFSPDGTWLASGSDDKTVRLWEAGSGRELRQFTGHKDSVWSVAFSPDGTWLASGSDDKTMRLWETASGRELRQFTGHEDWVWSVAFSPDGTWLASGSADKTVRLWEAGSGRERRQFTGHQGWVRSVAFSPDGNCLASGSDDNTVRLWNTATGAMELVLMPSAEGWVAFAPDGRYKHAGHPAGGFWFMVNLCRFELGELDPFLPNVRRLPLDEPFRSVS
jgi:WD40 repeat protein/3',5'-cyclic AMP phosphodiesterase CpdA